MKMNKTLLQIIELWKNNAKYFSATFLLILGMAVAIRSFQILLPSLSANNKPAVSPAVKKDTLYVSLLNGYSNTNRVADTSKSITNNGVTPDDSARYYPIANTESVRTNLFAGKADQIKSSEQNARLSGMSTAVPIWFIIIAIVIILAIVLYSNFKYLPYIDPDLTQDRDPEELTKAFDNLAQQIKELGNPRKIKRFSNKIRFQYNYLKNKKAIKTKVDLDNIMQALVAIEYKNDKFDLTHTSKRLITGNEKLLAYFLELNKMDIGS